MSVITISRGTFSGGKMLAECLAAELGYRLIDRDVIVERAAAYGVSQEELREAMEKPPSFLERFRHRRYMYLALVQAALTEEIRHGKAIYHGLAGHLLLPGGAAVLRTRIIAPLEFRIAMAQERLKFSRAEAVAYIHRVDQERRKWTQYLYGVDWGDPSLYDLVVNLEYLSIKEACQLIAFTVRRRCYEFTPECRRTMEDLALASRVKANLAIHPPTSHLEFEVEAQEGAVRIRGKVSRVEEIDEVQRVALETPGVKQADVRELVPSVHV
jgi:cytidylate kinase